MSREKVSDLIRDFYDREGWQCLEDGTTKDAFLNEDLRKSACDYVSRCRLRLLKYLPKSGDRLLDMASGPIQYPEYLEYSKNFRKRHCVDLSKQALELARAKIGDHGIFTVGDFLDISFEKNTFDAAISCHTIYHIHRDAQADAVNKLLDITKPNAPVIIIYSNPNIFYQKIIRTLKYCLGKEKKTHPTSDFYVYSHPISFWNQFKERADLQIYPWRSFSARHQKTLFPDNRLGKWMFKILFKLEDCFPKFFIANFKFYTVVLHKK